MKERERRATIFLEAGYLQKRRRTTISIDEQRENKKVLRENHGKEKEKVDL